MVFNVVGFLPAGFCLRARLAYVHRLPSCLVWSYYSIPARMLSTPFFKFFSRIFQNRPEPLEFQRKKFYAKALGAAEAGEIGEISLYIRKGPSLRRCAAGQPSAGQPTRQIATSRAGEKKDRTPHALHHIGRKAPDRIPEPSHILAQNASHALTATN